MQFKAKAARYGLALTASTVLAACAAQPQMAAIPQGPASPMFSRTGQAQYRTPSESPDAAATTYKFKTINNDTDPTFNQLLGINDSRIIAGYYGSGASASHPNKGYTVVAPYGQANFTSENYPGSVQTQVTCIDNLGNTGGFWIDGKGVNRGFLEWNGVFTSYAAPKAAKGKVTQILGLNDSGIAVGFYTDGKSINHGFTLNQQSGKFTPVTPPGATNVTVSAINNNGDVVGFYSYGSEMIGFLEKNGQFSTFHYPSSTVTQPFGVNDRDAIVGGYVDSASAMHGFLLTNPLTKATYQSIDDPNGVGTTTINGINNRMNMVGFYVDSSGNTDGMLVERKK
jgi:hypothetical protein